jgi:hypothetical protein
MELTLIGEHVRVRIRGNCEVPLPDALADGCPRHAGQVQRLILRWRRSCGENTGTPAAVQARLIAVRSWSALTPSNTRRSGWRSSRGQSSPTASNSTGLRPDRTALLLSVTVAGLALLSTRRKYESVSSP